MLSFRLPWRALQALRTVLQGRCSACPLPPKIFDVAFCSQLSTFAGIRRPCSNTEPCLDMQGAVLFHRAKIHHHMLGLIQGHAMESMLARMLASMANTINRFRHCSTDDRQVASALQRSLS